MNPIYHHITPHNSKILIHEPYIILKEEISSRLFQNGLVSALIVNRKITFFPKLLFQSNSKQFSEYFLQS